MRRFSPLAFGLVGSLFISGCSRTPSAQDVLQALESQYGQAVKVTDVQKTNGVKYPGGNGIPDSYTVEFQATLVPAGPVTFNISSGMEQAFLKTGAQIKSIKLGHEPDPEGMNVFFDIGTQKWRTDASRPASVVGAARFVSTENGWQQVELQTNLSPTIVNEIEASKRAEAAEQEAKRQATIQRQREQREGDRLLREGNNLLNQKQYAAAVARFQQSADLGNATAQNNLAWLFATLPGFLDSQRSLEFATRAVSQSPSVWNFVGTHAAALARNSRFDEAVRRQTEAISFLRELGNVDPQWKTQALKDAEGRLELYRQHKPYLQEATLGNK